MSLFRQKNTALRIITPSETKLAQFVQSLCCKCQCVLVTVYFENKIPNPAMMKNIYFKSSNYTYKNGLKIEANIF